MKRFKNCLLLLLLTICHLQVFGHDLIYRPLRCAGQIPDDFLKLSSQKVNEESVAINRKNLSYRERKLEKSFALSSNFSIDAILFSGKVLYGDPLTSYVNKVADQVLVSDKKLRSELRFYVLKTGGVNAFSTSQGIIFITVGLLSQVENEAQLAYILCHEIIHYKKKHTLESYKVNDEIKRGKGKFKRLDFNSRLKEAYKYSKENEIEADKEGLKLFQKSLYSTKAILSSFDMLLYSYLAYDEIDWRTSELEDSLYKFPSRYTPKKEKEISADEDEDDEESTHPNIKKRKEVIEKILENATDKNSKLNLLGEEYFEYIQRQSRIELFFILINDGRFTRAYYLSFLYKRVYNDSAFSGKIAAYSIYALSAQHQTDKKLTGESSGYKEDKHSDEGAYYHVLHFFNSMSVSELAILSLRTSWKAYQLNKNDEFCQRIFIRSAENVFRFTGYDKSEFYTTSSTFSKKAKDEEDSLLNVEGLSKVERLKIKQKKEKKQDYDSEDNSTDYYHYAYYGLLQNAYFDEVFDDAENLVKEEKNNNKKKKIVYTSSGWTSRFGNPAGIDSIVLVNTGFTRVNYDNPSVRFQLYEEKQELILSSKYKELAEANGIYVNPLNILDKSNLTTEVMNSLMDVNEFISERIGNSDKNAILYNSQFSEEFIAKTGAHSICLSSILHTFEKNGIDADYLIYSIILYPTLPFYLIWGLSKSNYISLYSIVYDIRTGKLSYAKSDSFKFNYEKKDYLYNQIYSMFHELKTPK